MHLNEMYQFVLRSFFNRGEYVIMGYFGVFGGKFGLQCVTSPNVGAISVTVVWIYRQHNTVR
jgi:uncharacterized membrane protein